MSKPWSQLRTEGARHLGRAVGLLNWLVYPSAIVVVGRATALAISFPDLIRLHALISLLVGLPRYLLGRRLVSAPPKDLPRLVNIYAMCVFLVAIHWAIFSCWGAGATADDYPGLLLIMVTAGLVAGSTTGLNAHLPTQLGYIFIMCSGQSAWQAYWGGSQERFTSLFSLMFIIFVSRAAIVSHRQFVEWLIANRNLSEALEQEQMLEERWSLAFDGSGDGVWDFDVPTAVVYYSPRLREMNRLPESAHRLEDWFECIEEEDRAEAVRAVEQLLRDPTAVLSHECRVRRAGASSLWILIRGKVGARGGAGEPLRVVGTCTDIDDQKQLQVQLNLARNLESVGQLAAGIAHEINTPVQYISDNMNFLKGALSELVESIEGGEPIADFEYLREEIPAALEQTSGGVRHIAQIVAAMREFTHKGQGDLRPTDLNHLVQNSLILCQNRLKYIGVVDCELDSNLPEVLANQSELSQVFLNLLINAADAVSERLAHEQEATGHISVRTSCQSGFLEVHVSDNGCGIAGANQSKVFEPFFTTKAVGKGTGQGLTLCRSIVGRYGGEIAFRSQLGQGTTFTVSLPLPKAV